jgi:hypothetical protein
LNPRRSIYHIGNCRKRGSRKRIFIDVNTLGNFIFPFTLSVVLLNGATFFIAVFLAIPLGHDRNARIKGHRAKISRAGKLCPEFVPIFTADKPTRSARQSLHGRIGERGHVKTMVIWKARRAERG